VEGRHMKNRMLVLGITIVTIAFGTLRTFGETVEEFEKKIVDGMAKQKSISYKMKSTTDMKNPQLTYKSDAEGTMEVAKRGEKKWSSRMDIKTNSLRKVGEEKEVKELGKILSIYDGEFSYTYTETGEQKMAMKMKPDEKTNMDPFDGKIMFKELHKIYDFKLLPDEKVDGQAVYVLELTAKKSEDNKDQMGMQRMMNYYRKDNGIPIKSVGVDKEGKTVFTSTISEVKLDEEIKPERFVFKAPAGVEVMDMTKSQEPPPEEKKEAKAEDKPAPKEETKEEPKPEEKPKKKGLGGLIPKVK
jgi:outer membrane lipoprotein-sorting protein